MSVNNITNYFKNKNESLSEKIQENSSENGSEILIESPTKIQKRQDELIIKNMKEVLHSVEKKKQQHKQRCRKRKKKLQESETDDQETKNDDEEKEGNNNNETDVLNTAQIIEEESIILVEPNENLNNNNQDLIQTETPKNTPTNKIKTNAFQLLMSSAKPKDNSMEETEDSGKKKRKYTKKSKVNNTISNYLETNGSPGSGSAKTPANNSPEEVLGKNRRRRTKINTLFDEDSMDSISSSNSEKTASNKRKNSSALSAKRLKKQKIKILNDSVEEEIEVLTIIEEIDDESCSPKKNGIIEKSPLKNGFKKLEESPRRSMRNSEISSVKKSHPEIEESPKRNLRNSLKSPLKNDEESVLKTPIKIEIEKTPEKSNRRKKKSAEANPTPTLLESDPVDTPDSSKWQSGRPRRSCTSKVQNYDMIVSPEKFEKQQKSPKSKRNKKADPEDSVEFVDLDTPEKEDKKKSRKANVKLAPLFVKQVPKPAIDPKILEARRNFLLSGLPETMRLEIDKQKQFEDEILSNDLLAYPLTSHVTQLEVSTDKTDNLWTQSRVCVVSSDNENHQISGTLKILNYGDLNECNGEILEIKKNFVFKKRKSLENLKELVHDLKEEWEGFPVNRCFKQLMKKNVEEKKKEKEEKQKKRGRRSVNSSLEISMEMESDFSSKNSLFVEKYKPRKLEEFLVNNVAVKELQKFFITFYEKSFTSDFDSDSESNSNMGPKFNNCVVLVGSNASGKTSSVYGLADDLNYHVIEINAGSKRTGKKVLQDLQEATQSHRIKKHKKPMFEDDNSSNASSQEDEKTIILIEDADVIFEDFDDGFLPAIQQLINISKRPVVLTSTNQNCQHLYKFMQQNSINFESANVKTIAKWLSILCLVENHQINLSDIENLYELNGHDLRKTINAIEFFIKSNHQQQQQPLQHNNNQQQSYNDNLYNFYYKMYDDKRLQYVERSCKPFLKSHLKVKSDTDLDSLIELGEMASITATLGRHCEDEDGLTRNLGAEIQDYLLQNMDVEKDDRGFPMDKEDSISSTLYTQTNTLSRKSSILDYDPIMRDICRSETQRLEMERRGSRFYHYLRNYCTASGALSNDYFNEQSKIFQ